ncbi:tubby-like protein 4 [Aristolochia californica]|uniref:tubby-like protein 4 n=1 Tax=Aristolochia californica TaxID=171875 RepID=UPI0035DC01EF
MISFKKSSTVARQSPYDSLYLNPLTEMKHNHSSSEGGEHVANLGLQLCRSKSVVACGKENAVPVDGRRPRRKTLSNFPVDDRILKPSSLQVCMQKNEPDSTFGSKLRGNRDSKPESAWDFSDSEAAPASSWATLPNRSLLCRPLPLDIGRCTCVIVKEASQELGGASLYSLHTNEGQGRQNRKLAVARHRWHKGRSEFVIAQNVKGILCTSDESFLGTVAANLLGSRYHIWDQGTPFDAIRKQSKLLLAVVTFIPTVTTLTGRFRSMRAWIPKHQSMQLKSTGQIQHLNGLPSNWEQKMSKTQRLYSKVPKFNNDMKRYELDFREKGKPSGLRIRSSVKNFQLIMEENGRQSILQLGRIGKSKYVMDYRFPLTAYQAFCICLSSIDSKLCCSV